MSYIGTQVNNVKKNTGIYNPNEILQLEKDGHWGGSLEHIQTQTASGDSSIDFTSIKESLYDVHYLQVYNVTYGSGNPTISIRFRESGTWETASVYQKAMKYGYSGGGFGGEDSTTTSSITTSSNIAYNSANAHMYFYNLGNSGLYSYVTFQHVSGYSSSQTAITRFGGGCLPQTSTVDGIRIFVSTTFDGSFKLYGIKQI